MRNLPKVTRLELCSPDPEVEPRLPSVLCALVNSALEFFYLERGIMCQTKNMLFE
jgi:hypothetical protein